MANIEDDRILQLDYSKLLSRSNITYTKPTQESQEGLPIGNGRMGTLVWIHPMEKSTVMFQPNRVDTWGCDRTHNKMIAYRYRACYDISDNLLSCCRLAVDVHRGGAPFREELHIEEGTVRVTYGEPDDFVSVTCLVWSDRDALAVHVDDHRKKPEEIYIELSMWRLPHEQFGDLVRSYTLTVEDLDDGVEGIVILDQKCTEGDFYSRFALALGVSDRKANVLKAEPESVLIAVPVGEGPFTAYLSSAATLHATVDVKSEALQVLSGALETRFAGIQESHKTWWSDFWHKSFLHLTSDDGNADYLERLYNLHLYQMASCSRGSFPTKFNGMLWLTEPDGKRLWGAQYWLWNTETLYYPLFASNHLELTDPYFRLYSDNLPEFEKAARQRWGAEGAFVPETTPFNGPVMLSDAQADELREFLLQRQPQESVSSATSENIKYDGVHSTINDRTRWGVKTVGPFSWVHHIMSSGCELAIQYWWRYQFTGNDAWLRDVAYPFMKSAVQFYLSYFKKYDDGLYHIYPTNVHEAYWGVEDGIMDLAAVRGVVPLLIQASEVLNVDTELRPVWREFLENLAPYPEGDHPDVSKLQQEESFPPDTFGAGFFRNVEGRQNHEIGWMMPVFPFEHITLSSARVNQSAGPYRKALRTYYAVPQRRQLLSEGRGGCLTRLPVIAARMGLGDEVRRILPRYIALSQKWPNGFTVEGKHSDTPQTLKWPTAEGTGILGIALQEALLQSTDGYIHLFPAWPRDWEGSFELLARGGFLVSSSMQKGGRVLGVEITSTWGRDCRLINPWDTDACIFRADGDTQPLTGPVFTFCLEPSERVVIAPEGTGISEARLVLKPQPIDGVQKLRVQFGNGNIEEVQLGK